MKKTLLIPLLALSLLLLCGCTTDMTGRPYSEIEAFIAEIAEFADKAGIELFISASMDPADMGDSKKYVI